MDDLVRRPADRYRAHMLSTAYLETMRRTADCPYTVRENSSGARVIFAVTRRS
jgi:hypothetical protein